MPGTDEWASIARDADDGALRERILTGYLDGKPFTPYVPTVALPAVVDAVLDFGCGVGRNFPYLKRIARHVTGFDLPAMVARCRSLAEEGVDVLSDDWSALRARRFDLIFATLVLQHVDTPSCRAYLADFARLSPITYLLTRLGTDFDATVVGLATESGLFRVRECALVEHDPATHRLRNLGRVPVERVLASGGPGEHYEVVLESRSLSAR